MLTYPQFYILRSPVKSLSYPGFPPRRQLELVLEILEVGLFTLILSLPLQLYLIAALSWVAIETHL